MRNKSFSYFCFGVCLFLTWGICADAIAGGYTTGFKGSNRSWSGCYIGLQGGYGWSDVSGVGSEYDGSLSGSYSIEMYDFIGGVYAGCNRQSGRMVFGLEADIEHSSAKGSSVFYDPTSVAYDETAEFDWLGSVRGRMGVVAKDTLFYLTAGWAYGKTTQSVSQPNTSFYDEHSEKRNGWTLGLGVEKFLTNRFIARLEYRFSRLDGYTNLNLANNSRDKIDDTDINVLRLGIAAKF